MNLFSRRSILAGLAAASTAAAAPTKPNAAPQEAPDLIALGDELPAVVERYRAADMALRDAIKSGEAIWPRAPKCLHFYGAGCVPETMIDGRQFKDAPSVATVKGAEASLAHHRKCLARIERTKSKRGAKSERVWIDRYTAALPVAREYWASREAISTRYRVKELQDAFHAAREGLQSHVGAIMTAKERTLEGVVIKAHALSAWGQVDAFWQKVNLSAPEWNAHLADSILRQSTT